MHPEIAPEWQCLNIAVIALIFYASLIIGVEIGGLLKGYPGMGKELNEKILRSIKSFFYDDKRK
jgi:hypothetical protein